MKFSTEPILTKLSSVRDGGARMTRFLENAVFKIIPKGIYNVLKTKRILHFNLVVDGLIRIGTLFSRLFLDNGPVIG